MKFRRSLVINKLSVNYVNNLMIAFQVYWYFFIVLFCVLRYMFKFNRILFKIELPYSINKKKLKVNNTVFF